MDEFIENDPIFQLSPAYSITSQDIWNWNNKSDFSGYYADLKESSKTLYLNEFIYKYNSNNKKYEIISSKERDFMRNCGFINGYIEDIDLLFNKNDGTGISLDEALKELNEAFFSNKLCYLYFPFNKTYLLITQLRNYYHKEDNQKGFTMICCTPYYDTNFFHKILDYEKITTKEELDNFAQLLTNRCMSISLIFEDTKHILFSHYEYI